MGDFLFPAAIGGMADWSRVFGDADAFAPLARAICRQAGLPCAPLSKCSPGTNAVFGMGGYILKIYAPKAAGFGGADFIGERFGLDFAARHGVSVSALVAAGTINDRYAFDYIITRRVDGTPFDEAKKTMTPAQKVDFAARLRRALDGMNIPCDWPDAPGRVQSRRWGEASPELLREREALLALEPAQRVFVHGDLCGDNVFVLPSGAPCLIDFGDCRLDDADYEHAVVACELFGMDGDFIAGYFGDYDADELAQRLAKALLRHGYGANIIMDHGYIDVRREGLAQLRENLYRRLTLKFRATCQPGRNTV